MTVTDKHCNGRYSLGLLRRHGCHRRDGRCPRGRVARPFVDSGPLWREVPLECFYKLSDRDGGQQFTKFYRFKNVKLLDDQGKEKKLSAMENLGLSPLPNGTVRLFSEYKSKD